MQNTSDDIKLGDKYKVKNQFLEVSIVSKISPARAYHQLPTTFAKHNMTPNYNQRKSAVVRSNLGRARFLRIEGS